MLTLLKAKDVVSLGLTCTQVFYLVGKQTTKGLCRFVKTDSIKTAIATLLSIKGIKVQVEDIRLNDMGGLKVFTSQGIKHIPRLEIRTFLTRYNQLAAEGCNSECKCAQDPDNLWKDFCIHRIAEHLTNVKEKIEAMTKPAPQPQQEQLDFTQKKVKRLVDETLYYLGKEGLVAFPFEDDGDQFIKVCQMDKVELGHVVVTSDGGLRILSSVPGSREVEVKAVATAIARLKAAILPPIPEGARSGHSWSKAEEYRRTKQYCRENFG